jgi:tRNA(Ser,Leu) C12 N-acetylase TAN1
MPATKAQRSTAARKGAATRKRHAAESKEHEQVSAVDRTTELSGDVFRSLESGQRAAIDAVRKFVDTVDKKLPAHDEGPAKRQEIVDAALEMADKLVHTQYAFLRNVVESAGKGLRGPDNGSK